ncbi:YjgN family protein [Pontibacterium sp.]|uniref:YjgN family protein n=1 Tax=Pontibacterium sp. TaxID=2036026 RepID=UPI003561AF6F
MNKPVQPKLAIQKPQVLDFQFHGKAGEFFRIWIVNLCLTILTLGIYSAWAKVRTHQYFYGHTTLGGSSFEYTALPMQILKGRLIAFGLFILYQVITNFFPLAALPMMLLFAAVLPWIIVRSMMFRHFNTRYRNIRFGFDGGYVQALIAYVLLPVGSAFTAGLLYPYAVCRQQRWLANHSRFGDTQMSAEFKAGAFYSIYLSALFLMISTGVLFFLVQTAAPTLTPLLPLVVLPFYYLVYAYIKVNVVNLTLNNLHLGEHRFESRMRTLAYLWIFISNTFAIVFTLGLATPWAMIRSANYRATCTSALIQGDLEQFVQAQQDQQNAFGEELGETLDLEFGV